MVGKEKINKVYTFFGVIVHDEDLWFTSFVVPNFYCIMQGSQASDVFLSWLFLINIRNKHDIFLPMVNIQNRSLIPIFLNFQFFWDSFSVMSYGANYGKITI